MKYIHVEKGVMIKSWCNNPEQGAINQAINLAKLPFAFKHVALMPDVHQGYGMPVGAVFASKDVIIPNAVGVDIGCGMCAIPTNIFVKHLDTDKLKAIMGQVREKIPVGFSKHVEKQDAILMPKGILGPVTGTPDVYNHALHSIGTLGGGNHFIEFQEDQIGFMWVMIHSGSRSLGKTVAEHYNTIAIEWNKKFSSSVSEEQELAFLPMEMMDALDYLQEMEYCVEYAFANRNLMMSRIKEIIKNYITSTEFGEMINIAHNYARLENHFNEDVFVHRKGATSARVGEMGIIPGSQGTASFIVRGKGNTQSFESCSHGAGRRMGRKVAQKTLDLEAEKKFLDDKGVIHSIRTHQDLDEAPGSYKDIDIVMKEQEDLLDIVYTLRPLAVIKG